MEGYGESFGAITVINAFANGIGAAIGIDLKICVYVKKGRERRVNTYLNGERIIIDHDLIDTVINGFKERYGLEDELWIDIYSEIPPQVGLKSSSSLANSLIIALYDYLGIDFDLMDVLHQNIEYSLKAGVSKTGALDDASASLLGGLVITDNHRRKIIRHIHISGDDILIFYVNDRRPTRKYINMDFTHLEKPISRAIKLVYRGYWREAALLNALIYSPVFGYDVEPLLTALRLGADTAGLSGKGPSMYMVNGRHEEMMKALDRRKYRFIYSHLR